MLRKMNKWPTAKGMSFEKFDFNTVFLQKHNFFSEIKTPQNKNEVLLKILKNAQHKSLVYAGTYSEINKLTFLLSEHTEIINNKLLKSRKKEYMEAI